MYEDALPEPALVRRLRRWGGFALSGDPRGVVVLVPDLAVLPGGSDPRQPRARCAAASGLDQAQTVAIAKEYDFVVVHTSTPSFRLDVRTAEMIKDANPKCTIAFVGGHVTAAAASNRCKPAPAIDFVARKEFDLAVEEVADGRDWADIPRHQLPAQRRASSTTPSRLPMTSEAARRAAVRHRRSTHATSTT